MTATAQHRREACQLINQSINQLRNPISISVVEWIDMSQWQRVKRRRGSVVGECPKVVEVVDVEE